MGLPIKHRKKYISHKKRWDKSTILEEEVLTRDYALKNKKEIRKIEYVLQKYKNIAKTLNREGVDTPEAQAFMTSLKKKGFLPEHSESLDDVLDITLRDILERRLSNVLYKKKLAKSAKQARQFIIHRHVRVNGKVVDSPSYIVTLEEEATIEFRENSALSNEEHPERSFEVHGLKEELEEQKELEEVAEEKKAHTEVSASDKKEEALDDEEQDEVEE